MNLEFELELKKRQNNSITYYVQRKGITIGELTLEEPYHKPQAIKRLLTMHDQMIKSKEQIIKEHEKNREKTEFKNAKETLFNF